MQSLLCSPKLGKIDPQEYQDDDCVIMCSDKLSSSPNERISAFKYQPVTLPAAFVINELKKLYDNVFHQPH